MASWSYTVLLLISTEILQTSAQKQCLGLYCLPLKIGPKVHPAEDSNSRFLSFDKKSGCHCRYVPDQWTSCVGRITCVKFPKDIRINTTTFSLYATQIDVLKQDDLEFMQDLTTLEIEGSYNLTWIEPGIFMNMTNLKNLSISYNANLKHISRDLFEGLINLEKLLLVKNGFMNNLAELTAAIAKIPRLQHLDLRENFFEVVRNGDFDAMKGNSLKVLSLALNQIEEIGTEALVPLQGLNMLRLCHNQVKNIAEVISTSIEHGVPLKVLNMFSVGFIKAPPVKLMEAIAKSNITELSLAKNQFEVISSKSFPASMPNLEVLDLRDVKALNITNDAFTGMPSLKKLLLGGNKLTSIPDGVLLKQLIFLDLKENSGVDDAAMYFSLYGAKFALMKKLQQLNLSFNKVHVIYVNTFEGLDNLLILDLENSTIFHIANNSFATLSNLQLLNLENNYFFKQNHEKIGEWTFKGLTSLEALLLGGNGIAYIKPNLFSHLPNLKHLGLQDNKLVRLNPNVLASLPYLKSLDLSQNSLQAWNVPLLNFNPRLRYFQLDSNKIMDITEAMTKDFGQLYQLGLENNPFTCNCEISNFFQSDLLSNQTLSCAFPEETTNVTVQRYLTTLREHCDEFNILLVVVTSMFLIFVTLSLVLVFYYRWHLRYWLFLTRLYLSRKKLKGGNKEKYCYNNYLYDAFVSYSNEDRNFVIRLVTMLENYPPHLKLCVYERDFEVGTMITENVLESVAKSRKTVLIISDSYAKSQWCRWESQIAEHHRLFFHDENGQYVDDSLILIRLGPVSEKHLTPTLKFLLKTRIYLQWDAEEVKQKVFWDKLRSTLKPPLEIIENTHL